MPSLRTRQVLDRRGLRTAEAALGEAAAAVTTATQTLTELTSGDLELDAINYQGTRLIWNGTTFEEEP
jgi:hypothetical protein